MLLIILDGIESVNNSAPAASNAVPTIILDGIERLFIAASIAYNAIRIILDGIERNRESINGVHNYYY
jgi:hypothetical protein